MISNRSKGTLCVNPEQGRHQHIPQLEWKCPPKLTLDSEWRVAAGEESTEAVTKRRVPTDPRLHAAALREASDQWDCRTPDIPIIPMEEEGNLQSNSSAAFLTTAAMDGETMSLINNALNALNKVALRQGEPPIGMSLFMQWLNSDNIRKFINGPSSPGIEPNSMKNEPTRSVPGCNSPRFTRASSVPQKIFSSTVTASDNMSSFNDHQPFPEVTMAPMSPLYSSPSANWELDWESDMNTGSIVNEYGTFSGKGMEPMPWKSLISPVVSFSLPQTELSPLPRASLQPTTNALTSLLHRNPPPPQMYQHSVLGVTAPTPVLRTNLVTSMGASPSIGTDFVTLLKATQHPAANMIHLPPAFGPSTPLMNFSSSLHGNPQLVGHGPSTLKPRQKPCIYFNSPRGCRNGVSCRYLHSLGGTP